MKYKSLTKVGKFSNFVRFLLNENIRYGFSVDRMDGQSFLSLFREDNYIIGKKENG